MEIKKITEKYNFYKDGDNYILHLGSITRGENTKTELLFSNVESLEVNSTCGCTVAEKTVIDKTTQKYTISYNNCDSSFSKVLSCKNKEKNFLIKIQGVCR